MWMISNCCLLLSFLYLRFFQLFFSLCASLSIYYLYDMVTKHFSHPLTHPPLPTLFNSNLLYRYFRFFATTSRSNFHKKIDDGSEAKVTDFQKSAIVMLKHRIFPFLLFLYVFNIFRHKTETFFCVV